MSTDPAVQAATERIERVIDLSDDYPPGPEVLARAAVEAARPITARQVVLKLHSEGFIEGGYVSAALSAVEAEDR